MEKEKTAKDLKKDELKQKKMAKFMQKQEKLRTFINTEEKKEPKKKPVQSGLVTYDIPTKKGDKKDVDISLPDAYSPTFVEAAWYDWWEKQNIFCPEINDALESKQKFIMSLPPPNVTGTLHLGHALTTAIEDSLARWHRMKGHTVLWIPGSDHAGIATQVIVEKQLKKEKGLSRYDLGREKFITEVLNWKKSKGNQIALQERAMGASLDWSREYFTMDKNFSSAVVEAFVSLHEQGLIYRSDRLVNWSCSLKSAISDIEVEKKEISGKTMLKVPNYDRIVEFGTLSQFAYKIDGDSDGEEIVVATTRLETMLGDTGIAVHPDDERYIRLHGKVAVHPFNSSKIPIICDSYVDPTFGTGAVKITPAHDFNDNELGARHNLCIVNILTEDGFMNQACGRFAGLHRFAARYEIQKELEKLGLFRGKQDHQMIIPVCSRSKDIVEPMLKPQWYLNCQEMAQQASQVVKGGKLKLIPETHTKTWFAWMDNIRDWCISRQLWWGHRIPAYRVTCSDKPLMDELGREIWVSGRDENEAKAKLDALKIQSNSGEITLKQDEDVLDTWFSSALVPFASLGWPQKTCDMMKYYPNTFLETGHDILFFWVARMVFMGLKLTGKLPFTRVYLHAMVRDAHGRKMSKSLGNIIDPMDVIRGISLEDLNAQLYKGNLDVGEIEKAQKGQASDYPNGIPECGTDALRFALCAYTAQGRDINLDVNRIVGYRYFCNKIWNSTKFILNSLGHDYDDRIFPEGVFGNSSKMDAIDTWILDRLGVTVRNCGVGFESYDFPAITTALHNFWLYEFCDIYIEYTKSHLYDKVISKEIEGMTIQNGVPNNNEERKSIIKGVMVLCLSTFLKLLHPIMPYITEELYQRILPLLIPQPNAHCDSICIAPYPQPDQFPGENKELNEQMTFVMALIKGIRAVRSDYNLPKAPFDAFIVCDAENTKDTLNSMTTLITTLTSPLKSLKICFKNDGTNCPVKNCVSFNTLGRCSVYIPLKGLVDIEKEVAKLEAKRDKVQNTWISLETIMQDPNYTLKVDPSIHEQNDKKVAQYKMELEEITNLIANLTQQ